MKRLNKSILPALLIAALSMIRPAVMAQSSPAPDTASVSPSAQKTLQTVTVTAARPFIVQKTDRIVLNVSQSPLAAGDNIYEVIKRAPGIVDQQGLQFRGKPVAVYVNDKPSRLSGDELQAYLSAMPAGTVEKVEIIPNPSARYEANGGTVINIVLARNKQFGTGATVTAGAGAGHYLRYNGGLSLNYRNEKMYAYGSFDRMHTQSLNRSHTDRYIGSMVRVTDEQRSLDRADNNTFRAGLDYSFSASSSMGLMIRGIAGRREKTIFNRSENGKDSSSTVDTRNRSQLFTPAVNLYYKQQFGNKGGALTLNVDHFSYARDWEDDFTTRYFDGKGQPGREPYFLRDNSPSRNRIYSLSADYVLAAGKTRLETGLKTVDTRTDNDVLWESFMDGKWTNDITRSNHFIYRERIYAAYASASRTIKKIDVQLGLRLEHTAAEGNSPTTQQVNSSDHTDLFPSLNVTYNQSDKQEFSFAYRRKIERFGFSIVNPFIIYQSQYAAYQGNPDIRPSFSHNFEAAWAYNNEWMAALSYSRYTDALAEVYRKSSAGSIMISSFDNVTGADQLGLDLTHMKSLFHNKLMSSNTFGVLHARYRAADSTRLNSASFTAYVSSNNMLMLAKHWKGELNSSWFSPMRFGAYHFRSQFVMNIGISRSLFDKNGTIALSITDVFNTNKRRYETASYDVRSFNRNNPETRVLKLAFSYRFGNRQVKAAKARKTGIEDVQKRMGE